MLAVVILISMYLRFVVCFVVVVVVVSPVVSVHIVVIVFADACAYLWWLLFLLDGNANLCSLCRRCLHLCV